MKTKQITVLILFALLSASCFKASVVREETSSFSSDKTGSSFSSELGNDTLRVTYNRSWSVTRDSASTWYTVEPMEKLNLSGVTTTSEVIVSYNRNLSKNSRSTEFTIKGEGFSQTFKVFQSPADSGSNISSYEPLDQIDTLKW